MRLHFVPPVPSVVRIACSSGTATDAAIAALPLQFNPMLQVVRQTPLLNEFFSSLDTAQILQIAAVPPGQQKQASVAVLCRCLQFLIGGILASFSPEDNVLKSFSGSIEQILPRFENNFPRRRNLLSA